MSLYLTYYIYLSCHPTYKEDKLLDKQEGSRSPKAFLKIFTRSRLVLAAQKGGGIMKGPHLHSCRRAKKKSDRSTF